MKNKMLCLVIIMLITCAGCIEVVDENPPTNSPENKAPKVIINTSHNETYQMVGITFNGSLSTDPDGNITSYYWDFGDGNISEENTTCHHYPMIGKYRISLTVLDDSGMINSTHSIITIKNALEMKLVYYESTPNYFKLIINVTNFGGEDIGLTKVEQMRWTIHTSDNETIIGDGFSDSGFLPVNHTNFIESNEIKGYLLFFYPGKEIIPTLLIYSNEQYYFEMTFN